MLENFFCANVLKFAKTVKKATFLMTITQCNSNSSTTLEFKCASFEKKNNLVELINIPTKAEERSKFPN